MSKTIFIVRGIPGAGKTTWASRYVGNQEVDTAAVFEADQYFTYEDGTYHFRSELLGEAHSDCVQRMFNFLANGGRLAFLSNVCTNFSDVIPVIETALQLEYNVKFRTLPDPECNRSLHGLTDEKLDYFRNKFQSHEEFMDDYDTYRKMRSGDYIHNLEPKNLKRFCEENPKLISIKKHPELGLNLIKYKRSVFYDNMWYKSPLLLETRGLVVNDDYETVVKPLTKIFNYGENDTRIHRDENVLYVDKINGYMLNLTYNPLISENLILSTTGSLVGEHVDMARSWVEPIEEELIDRINTYYGFSSWTATFEVCDPLDPHVIEEQYGLYLLRVYSFDHEDYLEEKECDKLATNLFHRPVWGWSRFSDLLEKVKVYNREGFVVYGQEVTLKLKSPYYNFTKFLSRASIQRLEGIFKDGNYKKHFDEEYYGLVEYIKNDFEFYRDLDEQRKVGYIRDYFLGELDE